MNNEVISDKQGISIVALFLLGSSIVIGTAIGAKKDLWIAILIAVLIAVPILIIYARILQIFPGKNLMEINELLFGKILGKLVNILYTWYAIHLGSMVLRNFGEYVNTVSLLETPKIVIMSFVIFLCIITVKHGIEVLARFGEFAIIILVLLVFLTIILLLPDMELSNIKPILERGIKPVLGGAISTFSFPFGETILFCMSFSLMKNKKSSFKIYMYGLLIGGLVIFITSLTEILVLGEDIYAASYFPAHITVRVIDVGIILQRVEIVVAIAFISAGFIKTSICLLGASKGIAKIFGLKDYRFAVIPIGLLITVLSIIIFETVFDMEKWDKVNPYYTSIFQVFIPIIVWITAEIKKKQLKNSF